MADQPRQWIGALRAGALKAGRHELAIVLADGSSISFAVTMK